MLCRKLRQTLFAKTTLKNNIQYQCLITSRYYLKRCIFLDSVLAYKRDSRSRMSSLRFVLRDLSVARLWNAWTRSYIVNSVVKRCRRDRSVREVFQCFRQAILRPRRTLLLSATAAFKSHSGDDEAPPSCEQSISDEDLQALVSELEGVEQLTRSTLFCTGCGKRLVIDKKQPAVRYCACKEPKPAEDCLDGWVPYMEAEDVIIWRKEYKSGQGLYAYKVYGRYKEVRAQDFAAVQVDGAYRRVWDAAVASLSVVERRANGFVDQAVLHWEVLWPRLFANRDYVYIRRHREFDVRTPSVLPHKDGIFETVTAEAPPLEPERPCVHSRAKRKAQEQDRLQMRRTGPVKDNKTFVIVSRSCTHPSVPVTKHAIRVSEYWSHMVVKSIDGASEPGMEFVLTYYDEPAVGGLPTGVATWATGRAAPAYLQRMRHAASGYTRWASTRPGQGMEFVLTYYDEPAVGGLPTGVATWATGRAAPAYLLRMRHAASGYTRWASTRPGQGMELVLTYYDEPAVGGLPTGVATWATGRAAPAYLQRMRHAASGYTRWASTRPGQELPDFLPFGCSTPNSSEDTTQESDAVREQDMESSKQGPELDNGIESSRDQSTQTEGDSSQTDGPPPPGTTEPSREDDGKRDGEPDKNDDKIQPVMEVKVETPVDSIPKKEELIPEKASDIQDEAGQPSSNGSWWRYLYPFYYFV